VNPRSENPALTHLTQWEISGLLFEVFVGGKEYRIFTTGRVEGFGDKDVKIVNYFLRRYSDLRQLELVPEVGVDELSREVGT
jgi:hypothetical protein